jgi:hypothetical protein
LTLGTSHTLPQGTESDSKEFVVIWYNGMDGLMSGGRSVEAGFGPNYFTKVKELRVALRRALWQVRHRHLNDLEYVSPGYEEFDAPNAAPATPKPAKDEQPEEHTAAAAAAAAAEEPERKPKAEQAAAEEPAAAAQSSNLYPMRRQTEFAHRAAAIPPLKRQPSVHRFMKCEECHQRKPSVHEVCGGGWVVCDECRFSEED